MYSLTPPPNRLGTGAARPPAPRVSILYCQCPCLSGKDKIYKNESAACPIGDDQRRNTGFLSLGDVLRPARPVKRVGSRLNRHLLIFERKWIFIFFDWEVFPSTGKNCHSRPFGVYLKVRGGVIYHQRLLNLSPVVIYGE